VTTILKIVVGLGLLTALVLYVDLKALIHSIRQANVVFLAIGSALVVVNVGVQFFRWRYLLRLIASDISDKEIVSSLLVGYSAGFFTPGQVGEHGGRVASLSSLKSIQVLAVSLIDKVYVLAVTIIVGMIGMWLFCKTFLPNYWSPVLTIAVIACVFTFLIVVLYPDLLKRLLRLVLHKVRKYKAVASFLFVKDVFHRRQARVLLLLTILFQFVVIVQYYVFVRAFEPVSFAVSALCTSNILFVKSAILPISIGDLGVRESSAIFFFSRAGVSAASALNASLCVFTVNILLPSLIGALFIMRMKTSRLRPVAK